MYLLKSNTAEVNQQNKEVLYKYRQRMTGQIISPDQIEVGSYYLYKEKFGMVCIVKIIEDTTQNGWVGFRMMVKRVIYSCWQVPKGTTFEAGYYSAAFTYPTSWHLEPSMSLIKSDYHPLYNPAVEVGIKSVL